MGIIADKLRNSTTQASDVYKEMNDAWHEAQDQQSEEAAQAAPSSPSWWDMLVNGDVQGMANAIGLNDTKSGEPYVSARDNSDVPNVQNDIYGGIVQPFAQGAVQAFSESMRARQA